MKKKIKNSSRRLRRALIISGSILLAVITVVVLMEVGLRMAAWVILSGRDDGRAAGSASVLCVGDSWTYGVESEDPARFSYPAQLQRLVDERLGRFRYRVINRGRPGLNSRVLRSRMLEQLERFKPSVVVLLVGGTNFYNAGQDLSSNVEQELSPWRRLRVVRLLALLRARRDGPRQPMAQVLKAGAVRAALVTAVSRPRVVGSFRDDAQGIPMTRDTGCPKNTEQLMAGVDGAVVGGAERVAQVLKKAPRCAKLLVHVADICFGKRKFECARRFAQEATVLEPGEPRAVVVQAAVRHHLKQPLARKTLNSLESVTVTHPGFMRARRLKALALLLGKVTLCELKRELTAAARACPRCGWVKDAMKVFRRDVQMPGAKTLRDDLVGIQELCQSQNAHLLLLNYPQSGRDVCGHMAQEVNAQFAVQRKLPIIEIGEVLGPLSATKESKFYGTGDHPNAEGYSRLARAVLDRLIKLDWVSKDQKKARRSSP